MNRLFRSVNHFPLRLVVIFLSISRDSLYIKRLTFGLCSKLQFSPDCHFDSLFCFGHFDHAYFSKMLKFINLFSFMVSGLKTSTPRPKLENNYVAVASALWFLPPAPTPTFNCLNHV